MRNLGDLGQGELFGEEDVLSDQPRLYSAICISDTAEIATIPGEEFLKRLKFEDQIKLNNFFHVHDSINRKIPPSLQDIFEYQQNIHVHNTRSSAQYCVKIPKTHTITFGINSITGQAARDWNFFQMSSRKNLNVLSRAVCKEELTDFILTSY